jgi:hypothetical protein
MALLEVEGRAAAYRSIMEKLRSGPPLRVSVSGGRAVLSTSVMMPISGGDAADLS